jgi:hypothetical protein
MIFQHFDYPNTTVENARDRKLSLLSFLAKFGFKIAALPYNTTIGSSFSFTTYKNTQVNNLAEFQSCVIKDLFGQGGYYTGVCNDALFFRLFFFL